VKNCKEPQKYLSHLITITGLTGVGTSSTIDKLLEELGETQALWRAVSAGNIMRKFGEDLGMKMIEEFVTYAKLHPEEKYDEKCDAAIEAYGRQNNTLIEGRVPHIIAPKGFHVLLTCPPDIRAQRRQQHDQKYRKYSVEKVEELILKRDQDDASRFGKLYPGYEWPKEAYHCSFDTSILEAMNIAKDIFECHAEWLAGLDPAEVCRGVSL
jgi:cytidylate kinase